MTDLGLIRVYASGGGGEVVDTPPAHLQQAEAEDEQQMSVEHTVCGHLAVVQVDEVAQPGDGGPRLLGVP